MTGGDERMTVREALAHRDRAAVIAEWIREATDGREDHDVVSVNVDTLDTIYSLLLDYNEMLMDKQVR